MSSAPYCKTGSRRCPINKKCLKKNKTMKRAIACKRGSRKCANGYCYKKKKSVKSRSRFNRVYNKDV